jgi:hypothetical protein
MKTKAKGLPAPLTEGRKKKHALNILEPIIN